MWRQEHEGTEIRVPKLSEKHGTKKSTVRPTFHRVAPEGRRDRARHNMLTKKLYRRIRAQWRGRIYSDEWVLPRVKLLRKYLHYLDGKDVLEIGANAGVFAYEICEHAKSYHGIEKEVLYYKQATKTQRYLPSNKAMFHNCDLLTMPADLSYNAAVCLFVLYHFYPPEVEVFKKVVLPQCDTIVIQLRNAKRKTIKNDCAFEVPGNTTRLLKDSGFKIVEKQWQPIKRQFVTIVGQRQCELVDVR